MDQRGKKIVEDFEEMKNYRSSWNCLYQALGEYVSQVKQNFQGQPARGEFLSDDIYDSSGTFAAKAAASALLGQLWRGSAKQAIEITKPDDFVDDSKEVDDFYDQMTQKLTQALDDPKANLALSLDEYMLDQMIFGTSGVGVTEGNESDLLFKSYGVNELYVDEGKNGRIDTIALFYEWTAKRVVAEYGEDSVSEKVRKTAKTSPNDKVRVLIMIQPRAEKKAEKGKFAMPFEAVHLEYEQAHIVKEEGFYDMPILIARFRKLMYEKYGRSPAMDALPDIKEANALREALSIAREKAIDMPIGIIDDGMLGAGYIDTSAKAVNVFNASNNVGGNRPVFDIGTPPKIEVAEYSLEKLQETISQHFNIDRLIDFNNDTQMTFGEAQIRDQIRTSSLLGLYYRQIAELFTPLIERCVNILFRTGAFGVVEGSEEEAEILERGGEVTYLPDAIQNLLFQGKDIYKINYKTKASNASKAEDYIAIIETLNYVGQISSFDESIRHRVNLHEAVKQLSEIRSLPQGIIRSDEEVNAMLEEEGRAAQQQQLMNTLESGANIYEKVAKGEASAR